MTLNHAEDGGRWPWWQTLLTCAAGVLTLTLLCCVVLEPRWETNDDIAMSMIAHGYGVGASGGSPNLIFSNVLWGYVVRSLPMFGDILGYSLASIALLVICATTVAYCLARLGSGTIICVAGVLLVFARPILFQQFTVNAGLLAVAAVLCWRLYAVRGAGPALALGCLLFFTGWLVRRPEAQLVLAAALPLLPWQLLRRDRAAQGALLALALVLVAATVFDRHAYSSADWRAFNDLNPVRVAYTDFGAGRQAEIQRQVIAKYGLSKNDIRLVSHWFFVDPRVDDPVKLDAVLRELPPPVEQGRMQSALKGVAAIGDIKLLPLLVAALLLTLLRPSRPLLLSWSVYLAAAFITGWLGRPGVLRVLVPMISLLALAPLIVTPVSGWRRKAMSVVVIGAALCSVWQVLHESHAMRVTARHMRKNLEMLRGETFIAWGAGLPYEHLFPVVHTPSALREFRLYGLGVFTLAPHSVAADEERHGTGLVQRLLSAEGMPLIASKGVLPMLETYCAEHHAGQLRQISAARYGVIMVSRQRCEGPAVRP